MTDITKKYKKRAIFLRIFSFLITIAPIIVYVIIGFVNGTIQTTQKVVLGFSVISAILLVGINMLFKYHLRSPIFILLLGIYCALNKITTLLIIIACGTVLDEFFIQPMLKTAKEKYTINREIDKRS